MDYKKKSSTSYSIKKVLKALFQKNLNNNNNKNSNRNTRSMESLESLDNYRNSQFEEHYEEIGDNAANEKLLSYFYDEVNSYNQYQNNTNDIIKRDCMSNSTISNIPLTTATTTIDEVEEEEDIFVPVRFARTEIGTYFWTTNLQPAAIITTVTTPLGDDMDLIQPGFCYTNCQYPQLQYQDRWAQA